MTAAPKNVGTYKIVASVEADNNYNGALDELTFVISQTENSWVDELSIENWTYGDKANSPTASSKYGTVNFTYSDQKDGTYTEAVPITAGTWYVKATVNGTENYTGLEAVKAFHIAKANSTVSIKDTSLDKQYDGKIVSNPEVEKTGSTKDVTFTWYEKDGNDWKKLTSAPKNVGTYKVVANIEADNNYNGASDELTFVINQTENSWVDELAIENWTYGDKANSPTASSKYGTVNFTYSDQKDGIYTETVPTTAGTWYVKAAVTGNENYTGLEVVKSFEIQKAIPEYRLPGNLTLEQGETLSTLKLPNGFMWKDEKQIADTLGNQIFRVIYTPEDTMNYQAVELDLTVKVIGKKVENNTEDSQKNDVETGDHTNMVIWSTMLIVSFVGMASLLLKRKKDN